jgi:hypothetical protein
VRYTTFGGTTSTQLATAPLNARVVNVFGGQLYLSSASSPFFAIATVGTGLPTTAGQTCTTLNGLPTLTGPSNYDYFFADANTLYIADDRTLASGGGVQKWMQSAGVWSLAYTLNTGLLNGCRGLSGFTEAGVTTVFATTAVSNANLLVTAVDTGAASTFSTLATAPANTVFRGVRWVRTPSSVVHSGAACANNNGTPTVGTSGGDPVTGNTTFAVTAGNCGANQFAMFLIYGGPVSPIGFPVPGTPACVQIYFLPDLLLFTIADPAGAASTPIPLPNSASLGGLLLGAQVAAFDLSLVGFDIPVGTSDALQITVGN